MKRSLLVALISRIARRDSTGDVVKSSLDVMGVCRSERARPRLAVVALAGLLLGQTLVPCGILLSSVHAAELRLKAKSAAKTGATKTQKTPIPGWARDLENRAAQQQRQQKLRLAQFQRPGNSAPQVGAEVADLECLDCEVDLESLDLSDVPTEKALRRAGGVEGALYPMRRAEPEELGIKLDRLLKRVGVENGLRGQLPLKDPRLAALERAQRRYERARAINTLFGRAVKALKADNRAQATKLFGQYMKDYPKTPWSGEALLHLGYEAKENGRLVEALQIFQTIADKTSEKPNQKLRAKKRERKTRGVDITDAEREADIDKALEGAATLEEAVSKLDSAEESDDDDESFEIHMKAKQQLADVDLLMGHYGAAQQKLSEIVRDDLNCRRRTWASSEWQRANFLSKNAATLMACGPQALGVVLASLDKSDDEVRKAKAPRAQGFSLAELKTLAHHNGVEMRGFEAQTAALSQLPLPAILHYDFGPDTSITSNGKSGASNGHFVVLQGVDANSQMVRVFDPSQHSSQRLSYAQLKRQWSGRGLVLQNKAVRRIGSVPSEAAMRAAVGGQTATANRNVGDSDNNAFSAGGAGMPSVEINRFSMNQNIEYTPMWYQPSRGPSVNISLNFNSLDSLSQYQKVGRKWMLNYTTYAYESNGHVIIVMPDASKADYVIDSTNPNRFNGLPGDFAYVEKSAGAYTLVFQDGSRWFYKRTATAVNFLSRMEDPWQLGLDFLYDGSNRLVTIRDADGKNTTLSYDAQNLVASVQDPFGRVATFNYFNNHLYGGTNMEGQAVEYRYGGPIISSITVPQAGTNPPIVWLYNQAGPASGNASITITATNPLADSMSYSYNASNYVSSETDYKGNTTQYYFTTGTSEELLNITQYPFNFYETREFNNLNLVKKAISERGKVTEFTYNGQGQLLTAKDAKQNVTTFGYDPSNGVDVTGVVNANNMQTMSATYNAQHQPQNVTDLSSNGTSTFTYTQWGALDTVIDALNRGTRYAYGMSGNSLRRLAQVQNSDAPTTPNGPRNWVTVGSFTYDNVGRVATATDAANLTVGYDYDLFNRVKAVRYSDNTREETTYLNGLPVIFKDRAGRYSYTEYDVAGNAKKSYTQDAQNNTQVGTVLTDYDKNGNLAMLTDARGKTTRWTYDSRDNNDSKTYDDGRRETYYYSYGQLFTINNSHGQTVFTRDANESVTRINYPNLPDVTFEYNKLNDVTKVTDAIGWHLFTYDDYGRLLVNDGPMNGSANLDKQSYTYDALQRVKTQAVGEYSDAHTTTYSYDALGRLASLNSTGSLGAGLTTYSYDGNSDRLFELTHPNGTKTRQQYDALGRLTYVFNGANGYAFHNRYSYQYDTRDVKTLMQTRTGPSTLPENTTYYTYDALDQLKQERMIGGAAGTPYTNNYNYDGMGNRTQVERITTSGSSTTTSPANNLNQITSLTMAVTGGPTTTANLTYDFAGNLKESRNPTDNSHTDYSYDDLDRLSRIEWRNSANQRTGATDFVYDYASRCAIIKEYNGGFGQIGQTTRVFAGLDVIREYKTELQTDGQQLYTNAQIVRDGNVSGILSRTVQQGVYGNITNQGSAFYGYDGNGNVTLLTDANGQDVGHYRYDAFGNTLEAVGPRAAENPYRFSTKPIHERSGFYDFGFRFYSPGMGRWLNRDPLEEEGGINLYAMVGNNPINNTDEYGLHWVDDVTRWVNDTVNGFLGTPKPKPTSDEPGADDIALAQATSGRGSGILPGNAPNQGGTSTLKGANGAIKTGKGPYNKVKAVRRTRKSAPLYQKTYRRITYSPRIRKRSVEDPGHHNFPYSFDATILATRPVRQSDGSLLYRVPGYVGKTPGVFEIALNPKTWVIFHRTFNASKNPKLK